MGGKYFFDQIPPVERVRLAELCGLTDEEREVFEARARTDSVVGCALRLNMSDRKVKRRSASVARKLARSGHDVRTRAMLCEEVN